MNARAFRDLAVAVAIAAIACGCGSVRDDLVLPWVKYRTVKGPGGNGIWSGSSHTEVLVRRWWGWSTAFDEMAGAGRPVVIDASTVLVMSSGVAKFLRASDTATPLACGDRDAVASVPPKRGFVDCVDHLAGPAPAIATSLRVRRIDPAGKAMTQYEFAAGEAGRVFIRPAIDFYDDEGTPYLVTFRDPWAVTLPDGTQRAGQATKERLDAIACELIAVGKDTAPVAAPPGHTVSDCSTASVWSRVMGKTLRDPWKS